MPRRFPEPWTIHSSESAFWVECADGKRFAYCYYHEGPQSIGTGTYSGHHLLTKDEARRIVSNIVKLPALLKRE